MLRVLFPLLLVSLQLAAAGATTVTTPAGETLKVADTFDKAPFTYRAELDREFDSFRVYRLTYPSSVTTALKQNNTVTAELYLPRGITKDSKPRPAVVCLHILGGGYELTELQCSALARRGIPAIWFKLPYYGERAPPDGARAVAAAANPRLFSQAVRQGIEDVRRTVDVLASRPEVDPKRIGVMGVSMGGILAATAAGEEPRISKAVLILAGGDLMTIINHARETQRLSEILHRLLPVDRAEVERTIVSTDPLQHAVALRKLAKQGRVLMINAGEDEVIPRACTEKLADALGIKDRVVWLDGLGHYTALAALPQTLKTAVDFFAKDLPADVVPPPPFASTAPRKELARIWQQCGRFVDGEPKPGHCHLADLEVQVTIKGGKKFEGRVRLVRGPKSEFAANVKAPGIVDDVSVGYGGLPWLASKGKAFVGAGDSRGAGLSPASASAGKAATQPPAQAIGTLNPDTQKGLAMAKAFFGALSMAPEILDQWVTIDTEPSEEHGGRAIRVLRRGAAGDVLRLYIHADGSPARLAFDIQGTHGSVTFHAWQIDTPAESSLFEPSHDLKVEEVLAADLAAMYAAALNLAAERIRPPGIPQGSGPWKIVARDPAGHGMLCEYHGKRLLFVEGTPQQMGTAHGLLLRKPIAKLAERVVYGVGAADTLTSGIWWFDRVAEIERRAGPHVPERFFAECDAMALAAGVSIRDARAANLFPERFHCSGVAVRGKATSDGRVLHARVLDYMRDIGLQNHACVTVFMPEGRNAWVSAGYAGFLGTVTAMNERGLAVGEMGGRGEGQWDGVPMSFLLRDVMERAATVEEALAILRQSPRTCEYYYVLSDKSRDMVGLYCTPKEVTVLRPGQQHPRLPKIPEDVVLISGDHRAQVLSERIQESYGRIDAARLMEIVKRPVAMNSNLHDAIFSPETLEFWIADAGNTTPACDEPYARFNLRELLELFHRN
jgi:dienelactone hydrolase